MLKIACVNYYGLWFLPVHQNYLEDLVPGRESNTNEIETLQSSSQRKHIECKDVLYWQQELAMGPEKGSKKREQKM